MIVSFLTRLEVNDFEFGLTFEAVDDGLDDQTWHHFDPWSPFKVFIWVPGSKLEFVGQNED